MRNKKYIPTQPNPLVSFVLTKEELASLERMAEFQGASVARIARGLLRIGLSKYDEGYGLKAPKAKMLAEISRLGVI